MLCNSCAKLAAHSTAKTCLRCQGQVLSTLAVICEACSATNQLCAACLKKVPDPKTLAMTRYRKGCSSCGRA